MVTYVTSKCVLPWEGPARSLKQPPACQGPVRIGVVTVDILVEMDSAIPLERPLDLPSAYNASCKTLSVPDTRSSNSLLVGDQFPIPAQNHIWFGRHSHFLETLTAQPMTDFGQCCQRRIRKLQPGLDLGFENAVFSDEIFIARQQFLVNRSGDIGQQASP